MTTYILVETESANATARIFDLFANLNSNERLVKYKYTDDEKKLCSTCSTLSSQRDISFSEASSEISQRKNTKYINPMPRKFELDGYHHSSPLQRSGNDGNEDCVSTASMVIPENRHRPYQLSTHYDTNSLQIHHEQINNQFVEKREFTDEHIKWMLQDIPGSNEVISRGAVDDTIQFFGNNKVKNEISCGNDDYGNMQSKRTGCVEVITLNSSESEGGEDQLEQALDDDFDMSNIRFRDISIYLDKVDDPTLVVRPPIRRQCSTLPVEMLFQSPIKRMRRCSRKPIKMIYSSDSDEEEDSDWNYARDRPQDRKRKKKKNKPKKKVKLRKTKLELGEYDEFVEQFPAIVEMNRSCQRPVLLYRIPKQKLCYRFVFSYLNRKKDKGVITYKCSECARRSHFCTIKVKKDMFLENPCDIEHKCSPLSDSNLSTEIDSLKKDGNISGQIYDRMKKSSQVFNTEDDKHQNNRPIKVEEDEEDYYSPSD